MPVVVYPLIATILFSASFWGFDALAQTKWGSGRPFLAELLEPSTAQLATRLVALIASATVASLLGWIGLDRERGNLRTQMELRQSRVAWDITYQFLGVLDMSGRLIEANRSSLDLIGVKLEDVKGKLFVDCPWWTHDIQMQERLAQAIGKASTGSPDRFEASHRDHRGVIHQIDFRIRPVFDRDGKVEYLVPEGHDITDLRQSELEQARLSQMLQTVLDTTPTRVFWKDRQSRFLGCNLAFARDAGMDRPSDLIGRTDHDMVWRDQAERFRSDDRDVMESGKGRAGIEEPQTRSDGSVYWLRTSKVPMLDSAGKVVGILGTYEDVTDSRQNQMELETSRKRLEEVNQELERRVQERTTDLVQMNRELETFAHSAAHDLRTPLRAIDGWTHAVVEDCAHCIDDVSKERLGRVRLAAQRIGEILDDLLRLSQASRSGLQPVDLDLAPVARELRDMLSSANSQRPIDWEIAETIPVHGDPGLLRLALWNLLDNAVKFTAGRYPARVEVGVSEKGFYVRDNGIGFDMAHSGKLFKAFQRLHLPEQFSGTGIGLALVRRIAERHGGWVEADGSPGRGATFQFRLG